MPQKSKTAASAFFGFVLPPAFGLATILFLGNMVWTDLKKSMADTTTAVNVLAGEVAELKSTTSRDVAVIKSESADVKRRVDVLEAWQRARPIQ